MEEEFLSNHRPKQATNVKDPEEFTWSGSSVFNLWHYLADFISVSSFGRYVKYTQKTNKTIFSDSFEQRKLEIILKTSKVFVLSRKMNFQT